MLGLMGFSGSLPLYVIHRYYIFVFIDRANKDACLLTWDFPDVKFRAAAQIAGSLGKATKFGSLYDIGESNPASGL